jgi:uncharacterized protein YjlB
MTMMPIVRKAAAPTTLSFTDDGRIPNNPTLPLVFYRGVIDLAGGPLLALWRA